MGTRSFLTPNIGQFYCIYITDKCMSKIRHFKLWGLYVLGVYVWEVCVLGGICPGAMFVEGKCPGGYMSEGKCPGGGGGYRSSFVFCPVTV